MKQTENVVKRVVQSFESFINPFDTVGYNSLIVFSTWIEVSDEVATYILSIYKDGKLLYFIKTRLVDKSSSFYAPLKRNKKKAFANLQTVANVKTSQRNVVKITAKRNLFGQFLML